VTPLTRRQKEVLTFIQQYVTRHGFAPTLWEIARGLQLSAISTVYKHLENLKAKGAIRRGGRNQARQMEIVAPFTCPTCGQATALDLSPTTIQIERKVILYGKTGTEGAANADGPLTHDDRPD